MVDRYQQTSSKNDTNQIFRYSFSPQTLSTSGRFLDTDLWQNNSKDDEIEQYILPVLQKRQKQYRKYDQNGIRKVKTLALQCLKNMDMKHLYTYWMKNKKDEGERNKRYIILLFVFLIANQQKHLVSVFLQKYKCLCNQIINENSEKCKKKASPHYLKSIKYHLILSIKAAQAFVSSNYDIDEGLKIMQNLTQTEYYENSKAKLNSYMQMIRQNRHKNLKLKETNMPCKN